MGIFDFCRRILRGHLGQYWVTVWSGNTEFFNLASAWGCAQAKVQDNCIWIVKLGACEFTHQARLSIQL